MNKIESALRLASDGCYVFPVVPDGKMPAVKKWQDIATRDQAQINQWWKEDPNFNIGVFTGRYQDDSRLLVIDVDVKNDKDGMGSWKQLRKEHGLQRTRRNKTPSGGEHIIYATDELVRSSAGKIADGLDIRSAGGFIVGPGSTIDGKDYTTDELPIEQAPNCLVNLCGRPSKKQTTFCDFGSFDSDVTIEQAKAWLRDEAPSAIQGLGGDEATYKVAAHLKDKGLSELVILELMAENWNETKADPPWEYVNLAQKVSNAYQYGVNDPGSGSAQSDFDVVHVDPSLKTPKRKKLFYLTASQVTADLNRTDLIRGLLSEQSMSIVYGESNTGKTFLTLKMAYCIATGRPFCNRRVEQGAVVYVAAEGGLSVYNRVVALKQEYGVTDFPMAVVPCPVDLLNTKADTNDLIDLIEQVEDDCGQKVKFVVIDTLSRALAGGNENSPEDMGVFVMHVDKIRHATKTHLCIVHHSGKDRARGARGHSLLRAGTDTELEVANNQLKSTKQRDRENGPPLAFDLIVHSLGTNKYGEDVTSCVLEELEVPADADFDDQYTDRQLAAIEVLEDLARKQNPVDIAAWRKQMRSTSPFQKLENDRSYLTAAKRMREFLVDRGVALFDEEKQRLTCLVDKGVDTENV